MNQNFIENFQFLVKQGIAKRHGSEEQRLKVRNISRSDLLLKRFLLEDRDIRLSTFLRIADEFEIVLQCQPKMFLTFEEQNQREEQSEERL